MIELTPATHNPPAGCLVDTVLNVDFAPPVEKPVEETTIVEMNKNYEGTLKSDQFVKFQVKLVDPSKALLFEIESVAGKPDLYVSTKNTDVCIIEGSFYFTKSSNISLILENLNGHVIPVRVWEDFVSSPKIPTSADHGTTLLYTRTGNREHINLSCNR